MTRALSRFAHNLGGAALRDAGAGIAFFMVTSHHNRDPRLIAHVAGTVVIADPAFIAAQCYSPIRRHVLAGTVQPPGRDGRYREWPPCPPQPSDWRRSGLRPVQDPPSETPPDRLDVHVHPEVRNHTRTAFGMITIRLQLINITAPQ